MAVPNSVWHERYRRLVRREPVGPAGDSIAAGDLRVGDQFLWADLTITVIGLRDIPGPFIAVTGYDDNQDSELVVDVHVAEEIIVVGHRPKEART